MKKKNIKTIHFKIKIKTKFIKMNQDIINIVYKMNNMMLDLEMPRLFIKYLYKKVPMINPQKQKTLT